MKLSKINEINLPYGYRKVIKRSSKRNDNVILKADKFREVVVMSATYLS